MELIGKNFPLAEEVKGTTCSACRAPPNRFLSKNTTSDKMAVCSVYLFSPLFLPSPPVRL